MCELCELKKITKWYKETPTYVILDCKTCGAVMLMYRAHSMKVPPATLFSMLYSLADVADKVYGGNQWRVRFNQRKIKDHFHVHAEKIN